VQLFDALEQFRGTLVTLLHNRGLPPWWKNVVSPWQSMEGGDFAVVSSIASPQGSQHTIAELSREGVQKRWLSGVSISQKAAQIEFLIRTQ
jgi:hypothetical protein